MTNKIPHRPPVEPNTLHHIPLQVEYKFTCLICHTIFTARSGHAKYCLNCKKKEKTLIRRKYQRHYYKKHAQEICARERRKRRNKKKK